MNHKQFEKWILDEPDLSNTQQRKLDEHLLVCPECRQLAHHWQASKKLLLNAVTKATTAGFGQRWTVYSQKKFQVEKVRHYRLTMFSLLLLAFSASLIYMITSGSFLKMLADTFNGISNLLIALTYGLSNLGTWLDRVHIALPISIGFIFFGLVNAFIMTGVFILWHSKQRKLQPNEIPVE